MRFSPRFYRAAGIASVISAITTCGLIFLPDFYPPVPDFEARMALGSHWAYLLRSWVYLIHPFFVFTALLAVAMRCRIRASGAAILGLAGIALWAGTEAAQQAITKVGLDHTWRAAWPTADEAARAVIQNQVAFFDVIWNSMFLLLLLGFLFGHILLGMAVAQTARAEARDNVKSATLAMWVAGVLWAAAALTALILLPELGGPTVSSADWLYPVIQPFGRTLIGVWLWREATSEPK